MAKQIATHQAKLDKAERRSANGREYLVAPVVAVVTPIAMNGALLTTEVLAANAKAWEGVAVPVLHPKDSAGNYISINEDSVQHMITGDFRNVVMSVNGEDGKLSGEVWIDIQKAEAAGYGYVVNHLEAADYDGPAMDVSTGFTYTSVPAKGAHKGRAYNSVYTSAGPDHLALLPDRPGACTTEDGCGIRANESITTRIRRWMGMDSGVAAHDLSFGEIGDRVRATLSETYHPGNYLFLEALYPDRVIYAVEFGSSIRLFERAYTMIDDVITVDPDAVEVEEVRSYEPIATNQEVTVDRKQKVTRVIGNAKTPWTDGDRALLEGMPDDQFNRIAGNDCGCSVETVEGDKPLTKEEVAEIAGNAVKTALAEDRAANQSKEEEAERTALVGKLSANSKVPEEVLQNTPIESLRIMANGHRPAADMSGAGGTIAGNSENGYTGKMPAMSFGKGGN